jgi:predicted dehydrogenase
MRRIRWGVISTGNIGVQKVIPAMQRGSLVDFAAVSSRELSKAQAVARQLGIAKAYGSYEALLGDPDIDAVYISTPNHLHVPLSIQSLRAGKHVLCEKPLAMDRRDSGELVKIAAKHS